MARQRPEVEEEEQVDGAPEWMVTFSDCMTLLLTFFVLLLSFAGFGENVLLGLSASFAKAMPSIWPSKSVEQESLWKNEQIRTIEKADEGTETRTTATEQSSNYMREKQALDFRNLKVFRVPSENFFWGNGTSISSSGRKLLDTFAVFLRSVPSRVVISEHGPGDNRQIGLSRAWAVLEYITKKEGLKKDMFSISTSNMTHRYNQNQRMLEITLLERNIYE
jgi:chemotaxis protein MotB